MRGKTLILTATLVCSYLGPNAEKPSATEMNVAAKSAPACNAEKLASFVQPSPDLAEEYIGIFDEIESTAKRPDRHRAQIGSSNLELIFNDVPTRSFITNLETPNARYYSALLREDPYFGDGFQFSYTDKAKSPGDKSVWILTPDFKLKLFGVVNQNTSYNQLMPINRLSEVSPCGPTVFTDLYEKSLGFERTFRQFLTVFEKYNN